MNIKEQVMKIGDELNQVINNEISKAFEKLGCIYGYYDQLLLESKSLEVIAPCDEETAEVIMLK